MAGRAVFGRDYHADIRVLQRRGYTNDRIARELGMSRATLYRILGRHGRTTSN